VATRRIVILGAVSELRDDKPVVRAPYQFAEADEPGLGALVDRWLAAGARP
jgi:hypothetical protein